MPFLILTARGEGRDCATFEHSIRTQACYKPAADVQKAVSKRNTSFLGRVRRSPRVSDSLASTTSQGSPVSPGSPTDHRATKPLFPEALQSPSGIVSFSSYLIRIRACDDFSSPPCCPLKPPAAHTNVVSLSSEIQLTEYTEQPWSCSAHSVANRHPVSTCTRKIFEELRFLMFWGSSFRRGAVRGKLSIGCKTMFTSFPSRFKMWRLYNGKIYVN